MQACDFLRVSLVQTHLYWQDASANRQHVSNLLAPLKGETDLAILPEMFTTGFMMQPEIYAEPFEGESLQWLKVQAQNLEFAIAGSIATVEQGRYLNRFVLVSPDGSVQHYDKYHLFRMGAEGQHYQAGTERRCFSYQGWLILPQVCYDLRFPVFMRNRNDYDLAIVVANWPAARRLAWRTLLQARAIENQAYVCGVNRIGEDGTGLAYSGDSMAIDFQGNLLIDAPESSEFTRTITLERARLQQFRHDFPAWMDADEFMLVATPSSERPNP